MPKDFITIQEAADQLGKSSQTIRRMIKRGDLSAKRIRTPQGFHYVIASDSIGMPSPAKVIPAPKMAKAEVLDNITVEKPAEALVPEPKPLPTNQTEVLTNQVDEKPQPSANTSGIDKKELKQLMDRHHRESMMLIKVIQKLQTELDKERRRPKSFLGYFFDWLSH